ncbi:hypothetical protein H2O64_09220 [Kordia sp. YSTF-M3]|uniref:Yip1 domain-containing protein n=1 Tax=Kordia aestuariivivens TaxID=2759037 RepID=A0ABR7Q947_9FLAO|nr:hypothetical protein [Kordia aestuariivivens]MBC8754849.1 hypothetical protein [Kordia aestuariivivens]
MGLLGDIDELKNKWKNASLSLKILVILTSFINLNAIASLSETIFKWKSFILVGIEFYNSTIIEPIKTLLEFFHLNLSETLINLIIVNTMIYGSLLRLLFWEEKPIKSNNLKDSLPIVFIIAFNFWLATFAYRIVIYPINFIAFFAPVLFLGYFLKITSLNKKEKMILLWPIIIPIIAVLVAAAFNAGLSR